MISGPIPPHPRLVVEGLLRFHRGEGAAGLELGEDALLPGPAAFLEEGLVLHEKGLVLGDGLSIDWFGIDGEGRPVAVLATEPGAEQDELPLRVLDLAAWFRRHRTLPRALVAGICPALAACDWEQGPRFLLVAHRYGDRLRDRLAGLGALDLTVLELGRLGVRGEGLWFVRPVDPRNGLPAGILDALPPALSEPELRALAGTLLERLGGIEERPAVHGDRFHREYWFPGGARLRLEARSEGLHVQIGGGAPRPLRDEADLEDILDAWIRRRLAAVEPADARKDGPAGEPRGNGNTNLEGTPRPAGRSALGGRVRLSEEEMAAFFPD